MFCDVIRLPDAAVMDHGDGFVKTHHQGNTFSSGQTTLLCEEADGGVKLTVCGGDISYICLRWRGSFAPGSRFMGDAVERGYGDLEWRGLSPERVMWWYFLAHGGGQTAGYGVKVRPGAFCFWLADAGGVTLWLDLRCGALPVQLAQRRLHTATVIQTLSQPGENAFALQKRFCGLMCTDALSVSEPVYGSNNWYYAYGRSSQAEILDDAKLIAELSAGLPNKPYMVIDDGWQESSALCGTCNGGPYRRGNYLFPDIERLAQDMRAEGTKPGIWVRPTQNMDCFLPESWFLTRDRNRCLDLSIPDVRGYIAQEMQRVASWGYELVKFDFSYYDMMGYFAREANHKLTRPGWAYAHRDQTNAEIAMDFYRIVKDNTNGAVLIGCNSVGHLGAGLFHVHRSGNDTSGRKWERTRKMGANTMAFRMAQHKTFFEVDADCVGVTPMVPWVQNEKWLRLLALSGTVLFASIQRSALQDDMVKSLKWAMAQGAAQTHTAEPLDWMDNTTPERWLINGTEQRFEWFNDEADVPRYDL